MALAMLVWGASAFRLPSKKTVRKFFSLPALRIPRPPALAGVVYQAGALLMHGCGQLIAAVDLCPAVGIVHQHLAVRVGIVGSGDHTGSAQIAQGDVVGANKAQSIGVGQAGTQEAGQKPSS